MNRYPPTSAERHREALPTDPTLQQREYAYELAAAKDRPGFKRAAFDAAFIDARPAWTGTWADPFRRTHGGKR